MIGIGINENVYLKNVQIDEKGFLDIVFDDTTKSAGPVSYFANVAADGEVMEDSSKTIKLFAPSGPKADSDKTVEKQLEMTVGDINKTKGIFLHILKGWYTAEQLKGLISPFKGTTLTEANFNTEILKKEVLEVVFRNMATDFIAALRPYMGKPESKFRLLLIRQSKDKPFATFRGRFLDESPFWETMDIPKAASKVAFTKWELENGFDSAAPVVKEDAADKAATDAAPLTAASVFGG